MHNDGQVQAVLFTATSFKLLRAPRRLHAIDTFR
jgi:hypothetical protein